MKTLRVEPVYQRFGDYIRKMRERAGISQEELAMRIGIGRISVVNVEAGRQRVLLADVERYAWALAIAPDLLVREVL
jgi:transcriptional regulator with XRE-family HTH domain